MAAQQESWLQRAHRALEYRREALEFISRARRQFPSSSPLHAAAITRLWLAADDADPLICTLLEEMNQGLLAGRGEADTTRGAALRASPLGLGPLHPDPELASLGGGPFGPGEAQETLFYECNWTLTWEGGKKGILLNLAVDAEGVLSPLKVASKSTAESQALPLPIQRDALQEALAQAYATEATVDLLLAQLQEMTAQAEALEVEMQKRALADLGLDDPAAEAAKPRAKGKGTQRRRGKR